MYGHMQAMFINEVKWNLLFVPLESTQLVSCQQLLTFSTMIFKEFQSNLCYKANEQ